jgi:O-antigen ligase
LTASVVFKGKDPRLGLLSSRQSPWQAAMESIREHFWFGTGFGTSDTGQDVTAELGTFSSTYAVATEHGSSYLAIITWVGMLGVLPFLLLVLILFRKVVETVLWMVRTGNPFRPAVPLAMVILAGMIHAGLEDWMFAPGNYLCVFYWSMAFIFVDQAPSLAVTRSNLVSFMPAAAAGQRLGNIASTR